MLVFQVLYCSLKPGEAIMAYSLRSDVRNVVESIKDTENWTHLVIIMTINGLSHLYEYVRLSTAKRKNQLESYLGVQKL